MKIVKSVQNFETLEVNFKIYCVLLTSNHFLQVFSNLNKRVEIFLK